MAGAGAGAIAGAEARTAFTIEKNELSPRPLRFWIEQETFLEEQLKERPVPNAANVAGLECIVDDGRITFQESPFEGLSYDTKEMRAHVKKLTGDVPSYTQLLADQQDYFYPFFVMTPGKPLYDLQAKLDAESKMEDFDLDKLYHGDYNDTIATLKFTNEKVKLLLEQMRTNLLPRILSLEDGGNPLCVYFFHTLAFELHALAGIFWKKEGVVHAGFYDTMYFERNEQMFDQYLGGIYVMWETLFRQADMTYRILNLSKLCLRTAKGRHCVQYVMNAEYCSIFVFYFFFLYAKHKYPTDIKGIANVIRKTYVAEPELLRRDACKETNRFRLTLIQFAMNTILLYTQNPARHVETYKMYNNVLEKAGYRLLTDEMYAIAARSAALGNKRGGGSRRPVPEDNVYRTGYQRMELSSGDNSLTWRKTAKRSKRRMQKQKRTRRVARSRKRPMSLFLSLVTSSRR